MKHLLAFLMITYSILGASQGFEIDVFIDTEFGADEQIRELSDQSILLSADYWIDNNEYIDLKKISKQGLLDWERKERFTNIEAYSLLPVINGFLLVVSEKVNVNTYRLKYTEYRLDGTKRRQFTKITPNRIFDIQCFENKSINILSDGGRPHRGRINLIDVLDLNGDTVFHVRDSSLQNISDLNVKVISQNRVLYTSDIISSHVYKIIDYDGNTVYNDTSMAIGHNPENVYGYELDNGDIVVTSNFSGNWISYLDNDCDNIWTKRSNDTSFVNPPGLQLVNNRIWLAGKDRFDSEAVLLHQMDKDGQSKQLAKFSFNSQISTPFLRMNKNGSYYILTNSITSREDRFQFLRVNNNNQILWRRKYPDPQNGVVNLKEAFIHSDGGIVILLIDYRSGLVKILKYDRNGNLFKNKISGTISLDMNGNCKKDPQEKFGSFHSVIALYPNNIFYNYLSDDGHFEFGTNFDSGTLYLSNTYPYWRVCEAFHDFNFSVNNEASINYYLSPSDICSHLDVDIGITRFRRCFLNSVVLDVVNTGTDITSNAHLWVVPDSFLINWNLSPYPHFFRNDTIFIEVSPLDIFEKRKYTFTFDVSCKAPMGIEHCIIAGANTYQRCQDPPDIGAFGSSKEVFCLENTGAYDPNDKRAFDQNGIIDRYIDKDSSILYQIRFQNTGTDTAFNVLILDTLSEKLDLATLEIEASSHNFDITLDEVRSLNIHFRNILLPDSNINEPASHGFINFRIRPVEAISYGDVISNSASIYFDFNKPIHTNEVELEIRRPNSIFDINEKIFLTVYPQPSNGSITILKDDEESQGKLSIYDLWGRRVFFGEFNDQKLHVDNLPTGVLFYSYEVDNIMHSRGKIIIAK